MSKMIIDYRIQLIDNMIIFKKVKFETKCKKI